MQSKINKLKQCCKEMFFLIQIFVQNKGRGWLAIYRKYFIQFIAVEDGSTCYWILPYWNIYYILKSVLFIWSHFRVTLFVCI